MNTQNNTNTDITLRFATISDAKDILEIYRPYIEKTAISFETLVPSLDEFTSRIENISKIYPYIVAVKDSKIVGYAYTHAFVDRSAYDYSAETTIYVDETMKKSGIGKRLYTAIEEISKFQGICNLEACIGYIEKEDEYLTNNSSQFHEHLGYRFVGRFDKCGYKFGRWYDMIWMEKIIAEHPKSPMPLKKITELPKETIGKIFGTM